jgi:hypothetical protein
MDKLTIKEEAELRIKAGIPETPFLKAIREGRAPATFPAPREELSNETYSLNYEHYRGMVKEALNHSKQSANAPHSGTPPEE